jgi:mono/diheme cytochrome c family protein
MRPLCLAVVLLASLLGVHGFSAGITPEQAAQLPPPASRTVDFVKDIEPIFEASCIKCHGRGKDKGGFRLDNRETFLKGGDSGTAVVLGKSADSLLIALVQGFDPDSIMPKKGSRLTSEQIGLLRAWIDQGVHWDSNITFGRLEPANMKPRLPQIPEGPKALNPIDHFLQPYFAAHQIKPSRVVSDRVFARRVYLDVIGLLPPPENVGKFLSARRPDKRERLVRTLLADQRNYAEHWLTFWNDLLRNDYSGTGYIDGGRKQITSWLYSALLTNMPYNQFVAQLINPAPPSEGFTKGIVWRGVVNASQTPQMQAAQSISQVFMGVNLKCASCHDSFINDLTLADAYGLAGIYGDNALEMVQCDKPTGKTAPLKFLYPELGDIDHRADKPARLERLAEVITQPKDGRLTRTFVNRLWQRFFGRGLVEPVDDMEKPAWNQDLLDWLAEDFVSHGYDVKFLISRIMTSQAYQLPAVSLGEDALGDYVFKGPSVRRMSSEQFRDALTLLTGIGYSSPLANIPLIESEQKKFAPPVAVNWIWNDPHAAEKARPGHVYFLKKVPLLSVPTDATALVVCDNSFTLFVNGQRVGTGSDFKTLSLFDLRPWLRKGENVFAIDAVNHLPDNRPPDSVEWKDGSSDNPAGLLFYARLRHTEGGKEQANDFASDSSWLCSDAVAEHWPEPELNNSQWRQAEKLGDMGLAPWRVSKDQFTATLASAYPGKVRASLVAADTLTVTLGRPNREQVVTCRPSVATTLQALELTNGETLARILKRGAQSLCSALPENQDELISQLFQRALGRRPAKAEFRLARDLIGQPAQAAGLEDLMWSLAMLPEFQLIY